jgi:TrmH family RNA methyltransferase
MAAAELITSASSPKIKKLIALQQKSSLRRESGLFTVEGVRELQHCLEAGFEPDSVFLCPEIYSARIDLPSSCRIFEVSSELYGKIAYREGTEGIVAEVKARSLELGSLKLGRRKAAPLIAVLESVEKPGNLGAVLRSADAAGADAVIICDPATDLFNPNLIRASIGAIFTVPCVTCSSAEAIEFLKAHGIRILTAQLQDSELYYKCDMQGGTAIVLGTESTGLTDVWRKAADAHIRIPMLGRLDSLNVSVSASILLYEAVRQRN